MKSLTNLSHFDFLINEFFLKGSNVPLSKQKLPLDIIKFGFGTSIVSNNIQEKVALMCEVGVKPYFGGTMFELYYARNQEEDYFKIVDNFGIETIEISDGSIILEHDEKCELIYKYAKNYTVLSEVGSKEEGILISPAKWIKMMSEELKAGSWKVIAEGRESGSVGIFRPNGKPHTMLINKIISKIDPNKILWEAPSKKHASWIKISRKNSLGKNS